MKLAASFSIPTFLLFYNSLKQYRYFGSSLIRTVGFVDPDGDTRNPDPHTGRPKWSTKRDQNEVFYGFLGLGFSQSLTLRFLDPNLFQCEFVKNFCHKNLGLDPTVTPLYPSSLSPLSDSYLTCFLRYSDSSVI